MSDEMVKRVCEAMEEAALEYGRVINSGGKARSLTSVLAIVAIKAMREPTEAMIEASNREWDGRMSYRSSGAWQACIDAALPTPQREG